MKSVKVYLIIVSSFLALAIIAGVVVWYLYQNLDGAQPQVLPELPIEQDVVTDQDEISEVVTDVGTTPPRTLSADDLSPKQREMLTTFGLEDTQVTITQERIDCGVTALGEARFNEVVAGSAPTPFEALSLLACMKE